MEYVIALLGQRFRGREVNSRTVMRYRSRREPTGVTVTDLTASGADRLVEDEVPVKEYFRIRRADIRYIARQLWKTLE